MVKNRKIINLNSLLKSITKAEFFTIGNISQNHLFSRNVQKSFNTDQRKTTQVQNYNQKSCNYRRNLKNLALILIEHSIKKSVFAIYCDTSGKPQAKDIFKEERKTTTNKFLPEEELQCFHMYELCFKNYLFVR